MVNANTSWHSPRKLPDLNRMSTLLETRQQECLPSLKNLGSCKFSAPAPLPGSSGLLLQSLRTEQTNEAFGRAHGFPSEYRSLRPTPTPYFGGMVAPNANVTATCPKGFLIFDQSKNQTRLIYNYFCPMVHNPGNTNSRVVLCNKESDRIGPTKNEGSETNGESEMREDTEEINALLDSEDDETGSDDDDDGEEVTSAGHSLTQTKRGRQKQELIEEEEVGSSDGPPNKKLKYEKSSPVHTASSVKLDESDDDDNDAKSSYVNGPTGVEGSDCTFGNTRPKKDKIRRILRVLESIVPGAKGKDPLFVIDEAIDYLSIAKIKAETLGASFH